MRDIERFIADYRMAMIVVATSGENNCQYCVVAHGAVLRIRAKDSLIADQVAVNYRKADITPKQMVMLDFATLKSMLKLPKRTRLKIATELAAIAIDPYSYQGDWRQLSGSPHSL